MREVQIYFITMVSAEIINLMHAGPQKFEVDKQISSASHPTLDLKL